MNLKKQKNINKSTFPRKKKHMYLLNGKNPVDKFGNMTHCHLCFSVNHWKALCPDKIHKNLTKSDKNSSCMVLFGEGRQTKDEERSNKNERRFNDVVGVNIMNVKDQLVIILIDGHTKYLEAGVVTSKDPKVIIDFLLQNWISIFGSPSKFVLLDSFHDQETTNLANAFNINLVRDVRESFWLIRLMERFSKLLHEHICEILQDVDCPCFAAVAWSISALNSLQNSSDSSPSQLVYGHNILLPSVKGFKPPILTSLNYDKVLQDYLERKRKSRNLHVYITSTQNLKRDLVNSYNTEVYIDSKPTFEINTTLNTAEEASLNNATSYGIKRVLEEKCEDVEIKSVGFVKQENQATNNEIQEELPMTTDTIERKAEQSLKESLTDQCHIEIRSEPECIETQSSLERKIKTSDKCHSVQDSGSININELVSDIVKMEHERSIETFIKDFINQMRKRKSKSKRKKRNIFRL